MEEVEIVKWKGNFKKGAKIITICCIIITAVCFLISGIIESINDFNANKMDMLVEKITTLEGEYLDAKVKYAIGVGEITRQDVEALEEQLKNTEEELSVFKENYIKEDNTMFLSNGILCAIISIITVLFYFYISKMEITVTSTRVYGKKAFGKRVDLPIDTISVVGTSFLKGIDIGTSSGRIHFKGIKNNNEIHAEISKLLNNRQMSKQCNNTIMNNTSNADELKKYKELLDNGVITKEEFEAKKKQLLNI